MSVLAWIVLGLIAGFVASNITKSSVVVLWIYHAVSGRSV